VTVASARVIAVDVGGTTMRAAVVDDELLGRVTMPTVRGPGLADALVVLIDRALAAASAARSDAVCVGVSVPGPVSADGRSVAFTGNVGLRDLPLADLLERAIGLPVVMDDDANCAALGEAERGAAAGAGVAVLLVVGTGIGAGIVIDGHLFRGANGAAGEVGHMVLDPTGPVCSCGDHGCFEAMAAGPVLAARGRAAAERGLSPLLLQELQLDPARLDAAAVIAAAAAGDTGAREAVEETGRWLGIGVAAVANAFDPDVIVLAGGLGDTAVMLDWARRGVREHCIEPIDRLARVETAVLGDDAGLWGAARLAWCEMAQRGTD
jgi:glucokinase